MAGLAITSPLVAQSPVAGHDLGQFPVIWVSSQRYPAVLEHVAFN
jgi:hypothetical protein